MLLILLKTIVSDWTGIKTQATIMFKWKSSNVYKMCILIAKLLPKRFKIQRENIFVWDINNQHKNNLTKKLKIKFTKKWNISAGKYVNVKLRLTAIEQIQR